MKIICFGDSVTRGVTFQRGRHRIVKSNYPTGLQTVLQTNLIEAHHIEIVNQGVFNDNSDLLRARLESDVLAQSPDVVLIEIGGNDCNFRWDEVAKRPDDAHQPIVPLHRYLENIQHIVTRIQTTNAVPVVLDILPLDPARYYQHIAQTHGSAISHWIGLCGGIGHWHGLYNYELRKLANTLTIPRIDIRTAFKQNGNLADLISDDGVHPTPLGYQMMAHYISQHLQAAYMSYRASAVIIGPT